MPRWKKWAILGGVVIGALLASYVTGRLQTAARISEAEGQAAEAASATRAGAAEAQGLLARVGRLESRRRIHLALMALDDSNFGIAQGHLGEAGALLAKTEASADTDLGKLGTALRGVKLVPTADQGAQRKQILDYARRFDELVPPATSQ
jgi:hypothetical protein